MRLGDPSGEGLLDTDLDRSDTGDLALRPELAGLLE